MNKLCCCTDPEVPNIAVSVTCACFESHVEVSNDVPDLTTAEEKTEEKEKDEEDSVCCCWFRKRHANKKKSCE